MTDLFIDSFLKANPGENQRRALTWAKGSLSYAHLFQNIQRRVGWFSRQGLVPGDRVAICLPKGPNSVELILSGFQLGLIMVPIDPYSPYARIDTICQDVKAAMLLTTKNVAGDLRRQPSVDETHAVKIVEFKPLDTNAPKMDSALTDLKCDDPALILMTSGSTGKPKGISLSHGNISTFINWAVQTFALDQTDRFISIAPLHFDLSMLDIYACLLAGGRVYLPTEKEISFPGNVAKILSEQAVSIIYAVPSFLQILLKYRVFERAKLPNLKQVLFAGEIMPVEAMSNLMRQLPRVEFFNLYGPTETNVVIYHKLKECPDPGGAIPIGMGCDHSDIRLLGSKGQEVAVGESGEICVRGPTVMLGYWGQDPVKHGFYYTGDHGFKDADGLIYFTGRKDHRVKIRGIRVNLSDIEQTAMRAGHLDAAIAILQEPGGLNAKLTLNVAPRDPSKFDKAALLSYLAGHLPRQVLPHEIICHEQFPYTSNGKVDRQKLTEMMQSKRR